VAGGESIHAEQSVKSPQKNKEKARGGTGQKGDECVWHAIREDIPTDLGRPSSIPVRERAKNTVLCTKEKQGQCLAKANQR